jgi:uncharacterized protein Yka (UPF0111/DUF47 family)
MANSVIRHLFFPNGNFILKHLHKSADRIHSLSLLIEKLIFERNFGRRGEILAHASQFHKETLRESQNLFETLSKNLITPFDREDIYDLGRGLKILSTKTDSLLRFLEQNKCEPNQLGLTDMCKQYQKAASALMNVVFGLENLKQPIQTYDFIRELKEHCDSIEEICERSMAESLDRLDSIKEILINKDLYNYFDSISKKLKEVGQVSESFIVKYA